MTGEARGKGFIVLFHITAGTGLVVAADLRTLCRHDAAACWPLSGRHPSQRPLGGR
ncbi:MAG: hypothetical protein WDN08_12805 [Rhizomicrobium sp.]